MATAAGPERAACPRHRATPLAWRPSGPSSATPPTSACRRSRSTPSAVRTGSDRATRWRPSSACSRPPSATRRRSSSSRVSVFACRAVSESYRRRREPRSSRPSRPPPRASAWFSMWPSTTPRSRRSWTPCTPTRPRARTCGELDEAGLAAYLYTAGLPDPDLLIRTGGDQRVSNFLLWQAAYAELYFCDCFWPDFGPAELDAAIDEFGRRTRRFGR